MSEIIDPSALQSLSAAVGEDFVDELIDTFEGEAPGLLEEMRRAQAAGDADGFRRAAHSLKSNANTFGAMRLADLAKELESMARASDLNVGDKLKRLEEEYKKAVIELKSFNKALLEKLDE
jgi:HPt (histidine-containing phosphotransfer) domain-containing protein